MSMNGSVEQCSNLNRWILRVIPIGVRDSRTFTGSHFNYIRKDALNIGYQQGTTPFRIPSIIPYPFSC
jgi:hypothetical protein